MMQQRNYKTRSLQYKAMLSTVVVAYLVTVGADCYLLATHLIDKDMMVAIFVATVVALMSGLILTDRLSR
jgi:hypothetical protein